MPSSLAATRVCLRFALAFVWGATGLCFGQAERPRQAAPILQVQLQRTSEQAGTTGLALPVAPRDLRRTLSRAQRAIADERYADAVEALSEILEDSESEDYFLAPAADGETRQSLKVAARNLLGSLPSAGREIYELQAGATARKMLSDAITNRQFDRLNEVSRRYFHTEAGYQATYLMGRYCLDQNQPVAAAIHLKRLRDVGQASLEFEPDLSFYLATSWLLSHNKPAALEAIQHLQSVMPGAELEIGGRPVRLVDDEGDPLEWLSGILADLADPIASTPFAWTMFRGSPSRTASLSGDSPIPKFEWRVAPTTSPEYDQSLLNELRLFLGRKQAPVVAMQPLATGDLVLMRTPHMLFGVDLTNGKRIWSFPWDTPNLDSAAFVTHPYSQQPKDPIDAFVKQRVWHDGVHGQLSCSGSLAFVLQDIKPLGSLVEQGAQFNLLRRGLVPVPDGLKESSNQLVALDLEAEGKLRWIVGGKDGESERLANAFFMGVPLPLEDELFLLAELQDEIRLCVLDTETGQLKWSQQIAQVESPNAWYLDVVRRLCGCSPSFADGIMVCPTASGMVLGVDVDSRSLLWAYEYRRDAVSTAGRHRVSSFRTPTPSMPELGERWSDNSALISSGCVLITPTDSNALHCIDLLTGEKRWTKNRADYLYVAGVHEDTVVLVGAEKVQGVSLVTGQAMWSSPLKIPGDAMPSGHGFLTDHVLHLPTTASELLRIDVTDGTLIEQIPTEEVLGNLICHGDYVISQSPSGLKAFLRRDRARDIVEARLKSDPEDLETWETYAGLLLGEGKADEAIEALQHAVKLAGDTAAAAAVRGKLVNLLLDQLEAENPNIDQDQIVRLATQPAEQKRYHSIMLQQLRQAGRFEEAIDHGLSRWLLISDAISEFDQPLVNCGDGWKVNEQVWLQQQFQELFGELTPEQEAAVATRWQQRLLALPADDKRRSLKPLLDTVPQAFAGLAPTTDSDDTLLSEGRFLELELQLLDPSGSPAEAEAQLIRLYRMAGANLLAERLVARGDPGTTASNEFPDYDRWPSGVVEAKELNTSTRQLRTLAIPVRSEIGWPEEWTLTYDQAQDQLEIRDGLGRIVRIIPLPTVTGGRPSRSFPAYARAIGQLIVVHMGNRLLALDALGERYDERSRVLWSSDDPKLFPEAAMITQARVVRSNGPFGQARSAGSETLGPLSASGVSFLQDGVLRCVDPVTGETRWVRENVVSAPRQRARMAVVYGNEDVVLVQVQGEKTARVFRTLDGAEEQEVDVPAIERQWVRNGTTLITWRQSIATRLLTLTAYDALRQENVWEEKLPRDTVGSLIGDDELAMLTPDGKFTIRRLVDGELIVEKQLPARKLQRGGLHVVRSVRDYVVLISDEAQRNSWSNNGRNVMITAPMSTNGLPVRYVSGTVFALDRETGEDIWDEPLEVRNFFVPRGQPAGAPWLVFMRNVVVDSRTANNRRRGPQQRNTALGMVDRRNGDIVYFKEDLTYSQRVFNMTADWADRSVVVRLTANAVVQLKLTDLPRLDSSRKLPGVANKAPAADESAEADDDDLDVDVEVPE
ncbi:MAG: PQQ-binding-like beta-propeller repeat protein [Planctomycetota bacterium]